MPSLHIREYGPCCFLHRLDLHFQFWCHGGIGSLEGIETQYNVDNPAGSVWTGPDQGTQAIQGCID